MHPLHSFPDRLVSPRILCLLLFLLVPDARRSRSLFVFLPIDLLLLLLSYHDVSKFVKTCILYRSASSFISLASATVVANGFSTITWICRGAQARTTAMCSLIAPNADTASGFISSNILGKSVKKRVLS